MTAVKLEYRPMTIHELALLPPADRKEYLRRKGELGTAEAALYCDMATQTLRNLIASEEGPEHLSGGKGSRAVFLVPALDRWNLSRRQKKAAYRK